MTARTTSAALMGLVLAALVAAAAFSATAFAATAPSPIQVRDVRTLPSLADITRTVTPLNAIVSKSDTFLVASHGFDDLAGDCQDRGWIGEDRTSQIYAHVVSDKSVNEELFTGLAPDPGAPDNLTGSTATTRIYGGWCLAVTDSGAVVFLDRGPTPRLLAAYPQSGVIRTYGVIPNPNSPGYGMGLPLDFVFDPVSRRVLTSQSQSGLGLYAYQGNGDTPVVIGGAGSVTDDTTLAEASIVASGLAVDLAGNIYFSDNRVIGEVSTSRVRMVRTDGRVVTLAGAGPQGFSGDGGPALLAEFNNPQGLAVDPAGTVLYVADKGNHRIRRIDLQLGTVNTYCGNGDRSVLDGPSSVALRGDDLFIVQGRAVVRYSDGVLDTLVGGGGFYGPASGFSSPRQQVLSEPCAVRTDDAGGLYFVDPTLRLVYHLDASGVLSAVAGLPLSIAMGDGALWFGADTLSNPDEVAGWVRPSGYGNGWSQRITSPEFSIADHPDAVLRFDARIHLHDEGPLDYPTPLNAFVQVQALDDYGYWRVLQTEATELTGTAAQFGPFTGSARFKAEVRVNSVSEATPLGPATRLRVIVQSEGAGSSEDGLGPDAPDGALVIDNLSLKDGDLDLVPPTDFEDGTTGAWTLSALNGAYRASGLVSWWTRDLTVQPVAVMLYEGFDVTDPSCTWTFLAQGDSVNHYGLYARLASPWFAMAPGDTQLLIAFSGKLAPRNSGRVLACVVRGKNAGDARPRFASPSFLVLNSGAWGEDAVMPYINQRVLRYPLDFQAPQAADSVQIVFYAQDWSELSDPTGFPTGIVPLEGTKLPYLDDIRLYQLGVDRDHDGVADAWDACPDSCAAGQDADGDGCVDATATMRHVESWDRSALPIHYSVSASGDPRINDGSDLTAISNGFATWTAVPGASLDVVEDPLTAQTNASPYDGVNLVTFEDDYAFSPNVIAITPTLSALRRTTFDDQIVLPGQIVDADMMFNPQMPFRTPTYDPGPGAYDLQSVVTHEAGHVYGLCHSGVLNSTMFFVLQSGTEAASLEADDQAALAAAYPGSNFATDFATITGTVVRGGGAGPGGAGYGIPGALVTAVRLDAESEPADSVASDYSDEGGNYALRGLAPGSYSVRVTPLDGEMGGYALTADYISDRVYAVAQSNFAAEWWCEPESDRDTEDQRGVLTLTAGETRAGINVITNADTIPPVVLSVSPPDDTTGIRIDTSILINFSERIDSKSLQGNLRLHETGLNNALGGVAKLVSGGRSIIFLPTLALKFDTQYQLDLTTGIRDLEGVPLAALDSSRFTTEGAPDVAITDIQPRSAPRGTFLTILGTGFDPAGTDSVEFTMSAYPGYVRGPALSVTPTSMIVRVPFFVTSGNVRVEVNGAFSNPFLLTVLPLLALSAPSHVTDVALSFAPTDLALTPDGTRAYAVGSGGIAAIDLATYAVSYGSIGAARSLALKPDGKSAVVTRPALGDVVRVNTDPASGTYLQPLGTTLLGPSATPRAIAIAPTGRAAFVSDPGAHLVYKVDIDPLSATHDQVVDELSDSTTTTTILGGVAVSPEGSVLLFGTSDGGARRLELPGGNTQALSPAPSAGGVAIDGAAGEALFAGAGFLGDSLLFVTQPLDPLPTLGSIYLGGDVRDVAFSPDGRSAYVANAAFNQLQMVNEIPASPNYHTKIAEVGTGSIPVAVSVSGFGDVIAVANNGSHSISLYRTGGTAALVRVTPNVARPGDVVALEGTSAPFGAGSQVDLGSGPFAPARTAPGGDGAAFVVPTDPQRDVTVSAVDSAGMRTLGLPFRVVDPIANVVPRETGFARMLDSVMVSPPGLYFPTSFTTMNVSPDGRLLAVTRELGSYRGEQLDFVLVGEDGANRLGTRLYSTPCAPDGDQILGAASTTDGKLLWTCSTSLTTVIWDADPASPGFGTPVTSWPIPLSGAVGPIAADPLGRYMVMGDYATNDSLHVFTPTGVPAGAIYVPASTHAIAVSPDGHWVVSAGNGHVNFGNLDSLTALPGPPMHGSSLYPEWEIAITLDGKRAVTKDPGGSFAIYNLDPSAGAVGSELYYGNPLPLGIPIRKLAPAPDGLSVIVSLPAQDSLAILDPSVIPPAVTYVAAGRPIGPMVLSADGRRLWTETGAGTTRDSLRLVSLSPAASLSLVSGGSQSGLTSSWLPQPLRFRATDTNGNPQVGAMLRFDGVSGLLPILDNWDCPLWHVTDANGEVSVKWRTSSVPGTDSLVVRVLGVTGTSVLATAQVVVADNVLPPAVVSLGPADGASGLNAGTAVSATFNKSMDSTSVAGNLGLYVGPNQVGGALHSASHGRTWIFQPSQPLAFSSRCSLTVAAGVLDTYGLATASGATSVFTIQELPALSITSLTPPAGPASSPVVIAGQGLSPVPSQNTVLFNGALATVTSATAASVVAKVPLAATSGPVSVQVGSATSNELNFMVLDPDASPGGVINNLPAAQGVRDVAITSDGNRAYVTNPASNSVTALDIPGAQTITNVTVGLQPQGIALLPDDSRAYVANTGSNNVSVIDIRPASTDYHQVVATIPVGTAPKDIAVSAVGPKVIVVNSGSNEVSIIDANPNNGTFDQVTGTINVGSGGQSVTVSPDGGRAFVATAGGIVVVIDMSTDAVTGTINVGSGGQSVTVSPDGTILFVLCQDGTLKIVNLSPGPKQYQVTGTINVGSGGQSVTVSPDGALLYVTGGDGNSVQVYSITPSNVPGAVSISPGAPVVLTLVATIPVGQGPAGIAIDPSRGAFALVCNAGSGTVSIIGFPTSLPPVAAEFDFDPNTLNLKSMGRWVTGYLEPEPPRTASEIVLSTVRLNGIVPADSSGPATVGDHDGDGVPDLMVKFDRTAVSLTVAEGDRVPVTVTGTVGPRLFTGTDSIKVKRAKVTAPMAREVVPPCHPYTVRWEVPQGFHGAWIAVLHTFDRGETWELDATGIANTGSYVWQVPPAAADSVRIGIVLVDSADSTGTNVSGVLSVSEPFEVFGPTSVEPAPAVLSFAPIRPNPAPGAAHLRFGLPRAAEVRLEVFDVQGRKVRTLAAGRHPAGWHEVSWNGRLDGGGRIGAGLYFVRLKAEGREFKQRLVWLW